MDEERLFNLTQFPDIGLYMDQIISLTETRLKGYRRNESEKLLTKSMINNYSKDDLLPPSSHKQYGREHLARIFMIYFLKQILAIPDVKQIMQWEQEMESSFPAFEEALAGAMKEVSDRVQALPQGDAALHQEIVNLCVEAYARKHMVEKLLDTLAKPDPS